MKKFYPLPFGHIEVRVDRGRRVAPVWDAGKALGGTGRFRSGSSRSPGRRGHEARDLQHTGPTAPGGPSALWSHRSRVCRGRRDDRRARRLARDRGGGAHRGPPRRDGHEVIVVIEDRGLFKRFRGDVRVRVSAPAGADVELSTASADVDGRGEFGGLQANTASGDVAFEHVGRDAQVNSASGDVNIKRVQGALTVNTASGDLEIGYVGGNAKVRSASGDVSIDEAEASLKIQTASGDLAARSVREGDVVLQTASGDIEVGVKHGSKLWIDARSMSGDTSYRPRGKRHTVRGRRPPRRDQRDGHERGHRNPQGVMAAVVDRTRPRPQAPRPFRCTGRARSFASGRARRSPSSATRSARSRFR